MRCGPLLPIELRRSLGHMVYRTTAVDPREGTGLPRRSSRDRERSCVATATEKRGWLGHAHSRRRSGDGQNVYIFPAIPGVPGFRRRWSPRAPLPCASSSLERSGMRAVVDECFGSA